MPPLSRVVRFNERWYVRYARNQMRRRFLRKASLFVYSCEDTDDSEHPRSSSSLHVQRSVANVQNLSDVVDSTCFHRVEDHVVRRPSYLDVIAADVGGKRF